VRAYIDTGCSIVTTRQTVAEELRLTIHPTSLDIGGYAGGTTRARGTVYITLTVDLITAEVEDSIQSIPRIVGQSFLNRANVTLVQRNNQIRLFEKHLAELPEMDELPPRKIALWAKDTAIMPPRTIAFIAVSGWRVRVRVTLQLTVSQSVCLGVEPNLGLLTRDIIIFRGKYISKVSPDKSCTMSMVL
jgi:hypothetical protein